MLHKTLEKHEIISILLFLKTLRFHKVVIICVSLCKNRVFHFEFPGVLHRRMMCLRGENFSASFIPLTMFEGAKMYILRSLRQYIIFVRRRVDAKTSRSRLIEFLSFAKCNRQSIRLWFSREQSRKKMVRKQCFNNMRWRWCATHRKITRV